MSSQVFSEPFLGHAQSLPNFPHMQLFLSVLMCGSQKGKSEKQKGDKGALALSMPLKSLELELEGRRHGPPASVSAPV